MFTIPVAIALAHTAEIVQVFPVPALAANRTVP